MLPEILQPREGRILRTLTSIEDTFRYLKKEIEETENLEKKEHLKAKQETARNQIKTLAQRLIEIEDKSDSKDSHIYIGKQIQVYINEINSKAGKGLKLCAKQKKPIKIGEETILLGHDNALINMIISDLARFVSHDAILLQMHQLVYTDGSEDAIEIVDLDTFLKSELAILNAGEDINYLTLRGFVWDFMTRIRTKFGI